MSRPFRLTPLMRLINKASIGALRLGIPVGRASLLTVAGRATGAPRSTPVSPIDFDGRRWLVASGANAAWVANARAAGWALLGGGSRARRVRLVEAEPDAAAPVLKEFALRVARGRWFAVAPDAPTDAFRAETAEHPVFEIVADH